MKKVGLENNSVNFRMRQVFQMQLDRLVERNYNVLVSHFGTFSQDMVGSISQGVEDLMISIGDRRMVIKRMFSILIEGLQNIRIHGELDDHKRQMGYLLIGSSNDTYCLCLANIIPVEDEERIMSFIDKINRYSEEELKSTYLSVLSRDFLSIKGGAGLGFITTRMKSGRPLGAHFFELSDEKRLFVLEVKLGR